MATTIRLAEGMNWVELEPLAGGIAKVLTGNVHAPGDLVSAPGGMPWVAATADGKLPGDTALSPFDLELRSDVVTSALFPRPSDALDLADLEAHPAAADPRNPVAKLAKAIEAQSTMEATLRAVEVTSAEMPLPDDDPTGVLEAPAAPPPDDLRSAA